MSTKTDKYIDDHFMELSEELRALVRIPSVESEALDTVPVSPLGKAVRDAEDYMLKAAADKGFDTFDGHGFYAYVDAGKE